MSPVLRLGLRAIAEVGRNIAHERTTRGEAVRWMMLRGALAARLRRLSGTGGFSHVRAQKYERAHARQTIARDFPDLYERWRQARAEGSLWHSSDDPWFQGDDELWSGFREHVEGRRCLEIGSGPFGWLGPADWISDRWIIDPLIDFYRDEEIQVAGGTFFTEEVRRLSTGAEERIPELVGTVDGALICRNALDHAEDPLTILHNVSLYAAPGCYFLFWTDLWHHDGPDEGHRNITRSAEAMDALLDGLGFEVLRIADSVRGEPDLYLEYGRLARKTHAAS